MPKFVPRDYQKLIMDFVYEHERCGVLAGMGMGKSSSLLAAIDSELAFGNQAGPTLVTAPLRVAQSTWPDEQAKWKFRNIEVQPIVGTEAQRILALNNRNASVFTTNYENIPWLVEWFKHNRNKWPFERVVADESTKLKGYRTRQGTKRSKALAEVAHKKVKFWNNLTGTPAPNGLQDLWGQTWFIDGGQRLGRTYTAYEQRWFQSLRTNGNFSVTKPLPHAEKEIQALLREICISVDAKDWFDLREPIINDIFIDLPYKARDAYRKMERELFLEIDGKEVEAFNAASKTIKLLQLANGALYTDEEKNFSEVHDLKLQVLDEIVEEAGGMPVLVAYQFKSDLIRLKRTFPKGRELDKEPQTLRDWNAGKIPVLFAHPASAGHGLSLQDGGNIMVYFSHWWNAEERAQILERIGPTRQLQAGHDRPVFVYNIIARSTVDEDVIESYKQKITVQDALKEGMKRRMK